MVTNAEYGAYHVRGAGVRILAQILVNEDIEDNDGEDRGTVNRRINAGPYEGRTCLCWNRTCRWTYKSDMSLV